jgi:hypothetical protein
LEINQPVMEEATRRDGLEPTSHAFVRYEPEPSVTWLDRLGGDVRIQNGRDLHVPHDPSLTSQV